MTPGQTMQEEECDAYCSQASCLMRAIELCVVTAPLLGMDCWSGLSDFIRIEYCTALAKNCSASGTACAEGLRLCDLVADNSGQLKLLASTGYIKKGVRHATVH